MAMTTWSRVGDFKHFLPRICELLASDYAEWAFPEAYDGALDATARAVGS
jgi:hypothetical protein